MCKKMILTGALAILVFCTANISLGGIPDLSHSAASWPYSGPETLSLFNLPDGSGHSFTQVFLPGTADGGPGVFVDATITLTVLDSYDNPIANFPYEDIWLESADGGMVPCPGGTVADSNTDLLGQTVWMYPLQAGGWSEAPMQVVINGDALWFEGFPLNVNSPDLNGDGLVNLSDAGLFSVLYFSSVHYKADFNYDGVLNLSDVGYFVSGLGANCP